MRSKTYILIIITIFCKDISFSKNFLEKEVFLKYQNDFYLYLNDDELSDKSFYYNVYNTKEDSLFNLNLNYMTQGFGHSKKTMANLQYYGKLKNHGFYFEPMIVDKNNSGRVLGNNYNRNGISGRIQKSFIKITKPTYSFYFGRTPIKWGESIFGSIIQSGLYPAYDNALLAYKLGKFKYELLAGALSSQKTKEGTLIRRYISGRRISIKLSKRYSISAGEQIIYTGENRQFSMRYLNPFIPYFLTGLEENERDSRFDNDNSMLFFHHRYMLAKGLSSIFNEIIIDDYQKDESGLGHAVGLKVGYDKIFRMENHHFLLVFEYTNISPLTYNHHGQFTSWQNLEHNIGYPFGGDIENFQLKLYIQDKKDRILNIEIDYIIKGELNTDSPWVWSEILNDKNELYKKYVFMKAGLTFKKKWGFIEIAWKPINQLNSFIDSYDYSDKKNEIVVKAVYSLKKSVNVFKF